LSAGDGIHLYVVPATNLSLRSSWQSEAIPSPLPLPQDNKHDATHRPTPPSAALDHRHLHLVADPSALRHVALGRSHQYLQSTSLPTSRPPTTSLVDPLRGGNPGLVAPGP